MGRPAGWFVPLSFLFGGMHMLCRGCQLDKPAEEFPLRQDRKTPIRRPYCMSCKNNIQRARHAAHRRIAPFKLKASKCAARARSMGVPCDITPEYLEEIWTGVCPALGVPIKWDADRSDEMASELDRLVPDKGYIKGNVAFISRKVNRLKNNATTTELEQLLKWMKACT